MKGAMTGSTATSGEDAPRLRCWCARRIDLRAYEADNYRASSPAGKTP